jgi:hypothetical protein
MTELDPASPFGLQALRRNEQDLRFRNVIYSLMALYIASVSLNSISILVVFWLRLFNIVRIDYQWLAAWAVGSGGLGAGSFAFNRCY